MNASADIRRTNWWYVLPPVDGCVLVVGDDDQAETFPERVVTRPNHAALSAALLEGPYPAIAVPDLDGLVAGDDDLALVRAVAGAVAPTGWMYAGFSNRPLRRGALSVAKVRRILRSAGLVDVRLFLAAPDHVTPAYLIPAGRRAEVDFFLRVLFFPYSRGSGARAAAKRLALRVLWLGASISPPWARASAWPSVAFVAKRRAP